MTFPAKKYVAIFFKLLLIIGVLIIINFIFRDQLVKFFYHHRFLDSGLQNRTPGPSLHNRLYNFRFSLKDLEFFNSSKNNVNPEPAGWRKARLQQEGQARNIRFTLFRNFFKKIPLVRPETAFSFSLSDLTGVDIHPDYDVYRPRAINFFDLYSIYNLADKLGIIHPESEYVNMYINSVDQGDYIFRESFSPGFMEKRSIPDGSVFMLDLDSHGKWTIRYIFNTPGRHVRQHLNQFLYLLENNDPNLLYKYFDLDYLARFEVLKQWLDATSSFIIENNLRYIFNPANSRIYPVLDESNLLNLEINRKNRNLALLSKQIKNNSWLKLRQSAVQEEMNLIFPRIRSEFLRVKEKYTRQFGSSFINRQRLKFLERYYEKFVLRRIRLRDSASLISAAKTCNRSAVKKLLDRGHRVNSREKDNLWTPLFWTCRQGDEILTKYLLTHGADWNLKDRNGRTPVQVAAQYGNGHIVALLKNWTANCRGYLKVKKPVLYLDEMVMDPVDWIQQNQRLNLKLRKENSVIEIGPGTNRVHRMLIVPAAVHLKILPGTELVFDPDTALLSFSPVSARGSKTEEIVMRGADPQKGFLGIGIIQEKNDLTVLSDFRISHCRGGHVLGTRLKGALSVFGGTAQIRRGKLRSNFAVNGLHVSHSRIHIEKSDFSDNRKDQIQLEFCRGTLRESTVRTSNGRSGKNGLTIKHSSLLLTGNIFKNNRGYGVNCTDHSKTSVYNNSFFSNNIAVRTVNNSSSFLIRNHYGANQRIFTIYRTDPQFPFSRLYLINRKFLTFWPDHFTEPGNLVFLLREKDFLPRKIISEFHSQQPDLKNIADFCNQIESRLHLQPHQLHSFRTPEGNARIDQKNRIIYLQLPRNSVTKQKIIFRCQHPGIRLKVTPLVTGAAHKTGKESVFELVSGHSFDFRAFPFKARLALFGLNQVAEYDLLITDDPAPVVEIDTGERLKNFRKIKNEPKISCRIRFLSDSNPNPMAFVSAGIEGRGKKLPKWKYGISLSTPLEISGLGAAKNWVLESSFTEKSLMRSKLGFDLFREIQSFRKDPTVSPESRFVEVILNNDYRGVYLLTRHVDRNLLEMNKFRPGETDNPLLFRAVNTNANFGPLNREPGKKGIFCSFPGQRQPDKKKLDPVLSYHSGFAQRYPKPETHGEHWKELEELCQFTASATDREFNNRIFTYFQREKYIDLWIFSQLVYDSDGTDKNRFVACLNRSAPRWFIIPWDKDGIMGRFHDMTRQPFDRWLTSHLFTRCMKMPQFRKDLAARYHYLRKKKIISCQNINRMIDSNLKDLKHIEKRNFLRWPESMPVYPDRSSFRQEISWLRKWTRARIMWLDKKFAAMAENDEKPRGAELQK